tara:strand:- start:538 stop:963 length:426 start_codon:yes stop_codon:yes gene_type:complete
MSEMIVNKLTGKTTAGSITIQGEGSNTTNIQQGLMKTWINHFEGTSISDSFNCTSLTDYGTGYHQHSYVNLHGNKNYAANASIIGDGSNQTTSYTYAFVCGASSASNSVHATSAIRYSVLHYSGSLYDQQMVQIMTVGDLA